MAGHFDHMTAAKRYAAARPYFHPLVIGMIKSYLNLTDPLEVALDVACGTGRSCVALKEIVKNIVGIDSSSEMIDLATKDDRITYYVAPAEEIPLPDNSFDMITVALAFHWLDRSRFLSEARRLLKSHGYLVIYNNSFSRKMAENPDFEEWVYEVHLKRYPTPPRNRQPFEEEDANREGFDFLDKEHYTNEVNFSRDALVDYILTQTNCIAAVEQGNERIDNVRALLLSDLEPFFKTPKGIFLFGGPITYLKNSQS